MNISSKIVCSYSDTKCVWSLVVDLKDLAGTSRMTNHLRDARNTPVVLQVYVAALRVLATSTSLSSSIPVAFPTHSSNWSGIICACVTIIICKKRNFTVSYKLANVSIVYTKSEFFKGNGNLGCNFLRWGRRVFTHVQKTQSLILRDIITEVFWTVINIEKCMASQLRLSHTHTHTLTFLCFKHKILF
jgi:hypothetical protein